MDAILAFLGQISFPTLFVTLISAFFVARWQANAQFRNGQKEKLDDEKRKVYQKLLGLLSKVIRERKAEPGTIAQLQRYSQELMLTSSGKVAKVYGDFLQTVYIFDADDDLVNKRFIILFGELVKAMREDLGNKSFLHAFEWYDGLRPSFTDIDTLFPTTPIVAEQYVNNKELRKIDLKKLPKQPGH